MPIYEYQCHRCGTFEVMQGITEAALSRCPTCKGKVERLVSRSSFVLKGSGWYATDYARSGSKSESATSPSNDSTAGAPEQSSKPVDSSAKSSGTDKTSPAKPADSGKAAD